MSTPTPAERAEQRLAGAARDPAYGCGRPVPPYTPHQRFFLSTVLGASRILTDRDKRILDLLFRLDKPEPGNPGGTFASAASLAWYLGRHWSEHTVRRRLRKLVRLGLAVRTGRTSGTRWFVGVPPDVLALCPPPGSHSDQHETARALARDRLDGAIFTPLRSR